jgi:hypothetical protein
MASTSLPLPTPTPNELSSTPNIETDPEIIQPNAQTETDKENIPVPTPTASNSPKEEDPGTPAKVEQPLPQLAEGEEKHDWEVVNASPSHSPSKDVVNSNIDTKKVLKSGVFGELTCPES